MEENAVATTDAFTPPSTRPKPSPPPQKRQLPPIFWVLAGLLVVLVLVGVGSIAYYFALTKPDSEPALWTSPWDDLESGDVSVGLAVWSLTDIEPEQLYRQAMGNDALETATAMTLSTPFLPGEQRLGWLTVLARRQAAVGDETQAEHLYQLAADLAVLDPALSDRQRAETLAAVAEGWSEMGREVQARRSAEQVVLIAQNGPELTPPVRRQLLEKGALIYDQLDDPESARTLRALSADALAQPVELLSDPLLSLRGTPPYNQEVADFQAARFVQAQIFVDSWVEREGRTASSQLQMLEGALIDEDLARAVYYEQRLQDEGLSPGGQAALLWDRVAWLIIKHRVASGLYGEMLVPNWTAELPAIRQTLHDSFVDLTSVLLDEIAALPEAEQAPATYLLYRNVLMWAQIGLYPDADTIFLANALNDALTRWGDASGIQPVAHIDDEGQVSFSLLFAGG